MILVAAAEQNAGRGQRGNSWEAQPGKNVTASFYFRPSNILPESQFCISETVALAIVDTLASYGIDARVKWPNDIYVANGKICGILIENAIMGREITRCIVGIGLNVNQTEFLSDAPNPVSMAQAAGHGFDLEDVEQTLCRHLERATEALADPERVHERYMGSLWRGDGRYWPFMLPGSEEEFLARIESIDPTGHINLRRDDGGLCKYAFKEVIFQL